MLTPHPTPGASKVFSLGQNADTGMDNHISTWLRNANPKS